MLRALFLASLIVGATACSSKCDRAADHVVTLAYNEMIEEASRRPDADLVLPNLPTKSELGRAGGVLANDRLAPYCEDGMVLDCVIAAQTSRDASLCEPR